MDEGEFRRLLDLFPVVRSRDFVVIDSQTNGLAEPESSRQSSSRPSPSEAVKEWHDAWDHGEDKPVQIQGFDERDAFWKKLKSAAERKVGAAEAERFCKTFQQIHNKLVHEELSSDAAQNLLKLLKISDT